MAIIIHSKADNIDYSQYNIYPDQFVSQKTKQSNNWIKENMDYFANVSYSQFVKAKDTFLRNYNLVKGNLDAEDYYMGVSEHEAMKSFTEQLAKDIELPKHVKHYPIINAPLNELVGELANRPDATRVKAFDEDSKNEELQFKTQILQDYIMQNAKQKIMMQMAMQGQDVKDDQQVEQMTMEKVQEYLTDYTSLAEKWGNHVLEACKMQFNLKEISEDCMRDLLICSREFSHIFETNDKFGFGVENLNPKNVWYLTLPDKKYLKDAFAAGTVHVMELSELIERFPKLTKKEIDHLRNGVKELSLFSPRESNINGNATGWDSIKYDTYSPLIVQERLKIESQLKENMDPLNDFLGLSSNVNTFGNKYVVVQAYWISKKKIGKVTFIDEHGELQTALVDENYEQTPNQMGSVEWTFVNQWYKGYKIGPDIYQVEEYKLVDYCPILGVCYEIKNVNDPKSFVDLIKPYQILFNICMNQLYKLLEKEIGQVQLMSIRHVPIPKDGDAQDALDIWEEEARKRGVVFIDDSPENLKAPSSFNQFTKLDLTRTNEIQSRYELAMNLKNLAWELVGTTRERLGNVQATQTATGTNAALAQSYAQTESYFTQHEYVMNDLYQAILDAAQYIETKKPNSTISYINTEGEHAFIKVNAEDIHLKDLQVYVTSRKKDQQEFDQIKQLAQPMLQNGASPYEIIQLYTTNSLRTMKQVFKNLKDKQDQMAQKQQQLEQLQTEQQQKQFEFQMQREEQEEAEQRQFEHNENELDRLNKKEIAYIGALGKAGDVPDSNDAQLIQMEEQKRQSQQDNDMRMKELQHQQAESDKYIKLELEKIQVEREKIASELAKAKMKPATAKPKSKKK
jgi:hypothetical protein